MLRKNCRASSSGLLQSLGQRMMAVIEKYAKDNNYTLILDVSNPNTPVLYASSGIDITSDIVSLYDKNPSPRRPARARRHGPGSTAPGRALRALPLQDQQAACNDRQITRSRLNMNGGALASESPFCFRYLELPKASDTI